MMTNSLGKMALVKEIRSRTGYDKVVISSIYDVIWECVMEMLLRGDTVRLPNIGTLYLNWYKARRRYIPSKGRVQEYPRHRGIKIRQSRKFKEIIDMYDGVIYKEVSNE